ncbi:ABC transporter ATP-binding protein [Rhodococcus wratislaviensis]|uniref:Putative ABC transporter ATP-binding protein n=1 Tax=Rhodococcus wratislaviensis NBRC 100605 TaxID=1219028 RepID=X0PW69_RHOWR|nr:ABC transporter ATP-binding protein [Rhodococcus wratislaviensis]GAF47513.1 putative ABC transporter ATP-binding protein [Rhodococcus wratislaviensis NBRC 100605]
MLSIKDVEAGYGLTPVLQGVSIEVKAGEIVAVLGPNGAGKSTLLRTISGLVAVRAGRIELSGQPVTGMAAHRIARLGVAHVIEGRGILPNLSVKDNLMLGSFLRPRQKFMKSELEGALEQFPWMSSRLSELGGRLSGGQQQMLAIARALLGKPEVLLLDEPSLGLSPLMTDELFETIEALRSSDRAVLIVEQQMHRTLQVASRGYVIQRGKVVLEGSAEVLRTDGRIEKAYMS